MDNWVYTEIFKCIIFQIQLNKLFRSTELQCLQLTLKNQLEVTSWHMHLRPDYTSEKAEVNKEFAKFMIPLVYQKVKLFLQLIQMALVMPKTKMNCYENYYRKFKYAKCEKIVHIQKCFA